MPTNPSATNICSSGIFNSLVNNFCAVLDKSWEKIRETIPPLFLALIADSNCPIRSSASSSISISASLTTLNIPDFNNLYSG